MPCPLAGCMAKGASGRHKPGPPGWAPATLVALCEETNPKRPESASGYGLVRRNVNRPSRSYWTTCQVGEGIEDQVQAELELPAEVVPRFPHMLSCELHQMRIVA